MWWRPRTRFSLNYRRRLSSRATNVNPGDRSKAYELKRELDRLELYKDYEDRFLDLFKKPG